MPPDENAFLKRMRARLLGKLGAAEDVGDMKAMFLDKDVPLNHRVRLLAQMCMHDTEQAMKLVGSILDDAAASNGESVYQKKLEKLNALLHEMENGPLRYATFLRRVPGAGLHGRALVKLEDGTSAFTMVPNDALAARLRRGDRVLLEAQARALLFLDAEGDGVGEEARLERRIGDSRVEVTLRGDERWVYDASQTLTDKLDAGDAELGCRVLIRAREGIAFDALPPADGHAHYVFIERRPVPDTVVERDIGAPPAYIADTLEHVRLEMLQPELLRRYRLRRCQMRLLTGVSGSGKSLSIRGLWRALYEIMAEVTGAPMAELPPRVMRLRTAMALSKWFGESEKLLDRFFQEVEQLADEPFVGPDGREHKLPVLAILEEVDGIARARGHDAIYDRVLTTILELLDPGRPELADRLIVFIATTNVARQIDMAFLRRIGGEVERFGRLRRGAFAAVLRKHLAGRPFASNNGSSQDELLRRACRDLQAWFFSPNGPDRGYVELTYAGSPSPDVRRGRDFLTGGLVDRAVQQAAAVACRAESAGAERPGLTTALLLEAFEDQIRSIVDRLDERNAENYLQLPDGAHVASVRRLPRPAVPAFELLRTA